MLCCLLITPGWWGHCCVCCGVILGSCVTADIKAKPTRVFLLHSTGQTALWEWMKESHEVSRAGLCSTSFCPECGLSNNKKDFRLKCWSGKLSQLYCFHVLEQWPETVLCLYLGDSDTTWENLSASGWVTSLQKHKYKHILCCIWQLSPYQATTAVLVF